MKTNFWKAKWKAGEIGFHRDAYNPNLLKWWHRVEAETRRCPRSPVWKDTGPSLVGGNHAVDWR